jgi:hypothetical protein
MPRVVAPQSTHERDPVTVPSNRNAQQRSPNVCRLQSSDSGDRDTKQSRHKPWPIQQKYHIAAGNNIL